MARIKKLKENGKTVYPATIWNAVVDPTTGMTLKQLVAELTDALNRIDASTLQGHGIVTAVEGGLQHTPAVRHDGEVPALPARKNGYGGPDERHL